MQRDGIPDKSLSAVTATCFMLTKGDISTLHRLKSDEVWHHYEGASVLIHEIDSEGAYKVSKLGNNLRDPTASYQVTIPSGSWFGSELNPADSTFAYSYFGLCVAPGWTFEEFEMADVEHLLS